jgi:hypothetical protein
LIVFRFLREAGGRPTHGDVVAYLRGLGMAEGHNAVVRVTLCAVRAVFDRILGWGITEGIRHVPPPPPRPVATDGQARQLCAASRDPLERRLVEVFLAHGLMPHRARMLGLRGTGDSPQEGPVVRIKAEAERDGFAGGELQFTVQREEHRDTVWLFASPGRGRPLSTRTLRRRLRSLSERCGLHVTCTALRLAVHGETLRAS